MDKIVLNESGFKSLLSDIVTESVKLTLNEITFTFKWVIYKLDDKDKDLFIGEQEHSNNENFQDVDSATKDGLYHLKKYKEGRYRLYIIRNNFQLRVFETFNGSIKEF